MLSYITDNRGRYIKILSDSQAAIAALQNIDIKSKVLLRALESMESLATHVISQRLQRVKAHVGVDEAAKEEAAGGMHVKQAETRKPWTQIKHEIEEYTMGIWSNRWKSDTRFKHTKEFYAAPNKMKSKGFF